MFANPFLTALSSLLIVFAAIMTYFSTIPRNKVPVKPLGLIFFLCLGILLAIVAIGTSFSAGLLSMLGTIIISLLALSMAFGIFWLLSQAKTPLGDIKVKVGDKLLPFNAIKSDGTPFNSDEFAGKRILFKFFRGGWCPYCVAEISSFESMLPKLEKYNIEIVALSKDTVDEAAIHKTRDNISFTLLSDDNLKVIQQYGVEHHKALGGVTDGRKKFGLPIAAPNSFSAMAIPTSLLIDEHGIIQWIDQSDDYRIRSNEARVMQAIQDAFR